MSGPAPDGRIHRLPQTVRYALNGLVATAVHFAALSFLLEVAGLKLAGVANALAAVAGITSSYIGSRHFVFRAAHAPLLPQAMRFGALYALAAALHGTTLFLWTDLGGHDYRIGFVVATALQIVLSYWGNLKLVFR